MTKLVTAVAVLQLVDAGKVSLDSPDLLAQHCPELASLQVLIDVTDGTPHFVPRSKPLTLRHLMTHTSGLSYTFTSELLARYVALDTSLQDAAGTVAGYCYPLVFQPGEKWKYSIGFQWAGILVERVSGMRLSEYFSTHIFKPLGIDDSMSFFPTPDVVAKLQVCCKRDGDKLVHTAGTYPLDAAKVAEAPLRGGGGLFGTAPAYLRFLQGVLASQGGGIISDASFHELFADSLAPDVARQMAKGVAGMLSMDATDDDPQVGHSVGMLVIKADSPHGPKAGSGFWGGLSSTQYWLVLARPGVRSRGESQCFQVLTTGHMLHAACCSAARQLQRPVYGLPAQGLRRTSVMHSSATCSSGGTRRSGAGNGRSILHIGSRLATAHLTLARSSAMSACGLCASAPSTRLPSIGSRSA